MFDQEKHQLGLQAKQHKETAENFLTWVEIIVSHFILIIGSNLDKLFSESI